MILILARSRDSIDRVMSSITLGVVLSGLALALASTLLVRVTVTSGLRPLSRFSEAVQSLRPSSLQIDAPSAPLPSEIEPVRVRLVETMRRLGEAFEREKRFTAAAAHELRTPIAELKSMAQYSLKWPEDADNARRTHHDILALALRMERLVTTLLAIARSERAGAALQREPIDIGSLVLALHRPLV
jgi:two-component system sensor histidine kinase QseC